MPSTIAPIAGIDTVRVCLRVRNVPIAPPLRGLIQVCLLRCKLLRLLPPIAGSDSTEKDETLFAFPIAPHRGD